MKKIIIKLTIVSVTLSVLSACTAEELAALSQALSETSNSGAKANFIPTTYIETKKYCSSKIGTVVSAGNGKYVCQPH